MSKYIKRDETNRKLLFLTFLSAFTSDPINYIPKGPSSSGKTYPVIQVSRYFSDQDVWMLGGLSPKALIHEYGNYDKEKHAYVVSLEKKILVFVDIPSIETFDLLKPILSHDKNEIEYRIVERSKKGKLQTKHAIIKGFPAAIFCTTESKILEE